MYVLGVFFLNVDFTLLAIEYMNISNLGSSEDDNLDTYLWVWGQTEYMSDVSMPTRF